MLLGVRKGKQENVNMLAAAVTSTAAACLCAYEHGMHAIMLCRSGLTCVRVCVYMCVCLLSQHLNDIKALCKLSPWQLFRFSSPLSV